MTGKQLREQILAEFARRGYEPDGREDAWIAQAEVTADIVLALEAVIERDGPVGRDGKITPAVVERRQQILMLHKILGGLDFGQDEDEHTATDLRSVANRKAAQARWAR